MTQSVNINQPGQVKDKTFPKDSLEAFLNIYDFKFEVKKFDEENDINVLLVTATHNIKQNEYSGMLFIKNIKEITNRFLDDCEVLHAAIKESKKLADHNIQNGGEKETKTDTIPIQWQLVPNIKRQKIEKYVDVPETLKYQGVKPQTKYVPPKKTKQISNLSSGEDNDEDDEPEEVKEEELIEIKEFNVIKLELLFKAMGFIKKWPIYLIEHPFDKIRNLQLRMEAQETRFFEYKRLINTSETIIRSENISEGLTAGWKCLGEYTLPQIKNDYLITVSFRILAPTRKIYYTLRQGSTTHEDGTQLDPPTGNYFMAPPDNTTLYVPFFSETIINIAGTEQENARKIQLWCFGDNGNQNVYYNTIMKIKRLD